MNIIRFPHRNDWPSIIRRPGHAAAPLEERVRGILEEVRMKGDSALKKLTLQFDQVTLSAIAVPEHEIQASLNAVPTELLDAIRLAAENITRFHQSQIQQEKKIETMPGVVCWRRSVAIEKVGLYIPGGTAPLFSTLLMLAIPAIIAGCPEIVVCTPPGKDGKVHPAVLASAAFLGIKKIYRVGGVQAIAAMTFGTETVPRVWKIFGPGNQFVTMAKQLAQQHGVAIDLPAGPSEVAVYADASARAAFVAADLLSQVEHGADSQVLLVTDHEGLISAVEEAIAVQLEQLPRRELASQALTNSRIVLVRDRTQALDLLNAYAPEHLILACDDAEAVAEKVVNAGSVFVGHYSPESAGDYASGTNHTLPTNGYAHAYSGVGVDSFVKKITFQQLTRDGLERLSSSVQTMAQAEGLQAHAQAVRIRLQDQENHQTP